MDDLLFIALVGGAGVAAIAGPMGCFVVWRRMAYFGDALAHGGLLGIALGAWAQIDFTLAAIVCSLFLALLLYLLQRGRELGADTLLGILSHGALAAGLIAVAFLPALRVDLTAYLFGDILALTNQDLLRIWLVGLLILAVLAAIWRPLLAVTIDADLARAEGLPVAALEFGYTLLLALTIALAMKLVGVLLITALLIIPAASARRLATTPEAMALVAAGLGMAAVAVGLFASFRFDTPAGPSIVAAAAGLFVLSRLLVRWHRRWRDA